MTTSPDNLVLSHRDGGLMWLTLNRADKANAMTVGMVESLTAQLVAAGTDPSVQAVLLSGAGERVFCAGVDVREQPADGDMARQRERRLHDERIHNELWRTLPRGAPAARARDALAARRVGS